MVPQHWVGGRWKGPAIHKKGQLEEYSHACKWGDLAWEKWRDSMVKLHIEAVSWGRLYIKKWWRRKIWLFLDSAPLLTGSTMSELVLSSIFVTPSCRGRSNTSCLGVEEKQLHTFCLFPLKCKHRSESVRMLENFGKLWKLKMLLSWKVVEKERIYKMAMEIFCIFLWKVYKNILKWI